MIAPGADAIIKARMRGYRPADAVVISLVGRTNFANPTVMPLAGQHYDWRWIVGLDVVLCISRKTAWRELALVLKLAVPEHLRLWDVEKKRGAEVYWTPIFPADDIEPPPNTVRVSNWHFGLDFSPFHEDNNKAFAQ